MKKTTSLTCLLVMGFVVTSFLLWRNKDGNLSVPGIPETGDVVRGWDGDRGKVSVLSDGTDGPVLCPTSQAQTKPRKEYTRVSAPIVRRDRSTRPERLILQWTPYYGTAAWMHDGMFQNCPVFKCRVTTDKKRLNDADVVVFHPRNIPSGPLPGQKWPHQRWLLFNLEPPYFNGIVPQRYNGLFNWTMTYRDDSDFIMKYDSFRPLKQGEKGTSVDLGSKKKLAAVMISNCNDINNRLEYVRELQKEIPVDFYGKCGDKVCPPAACEQLLKTYKFYLSFENGNCFSYITEKFWNPLSMWHSVPVVMGGASPRDYEKIAPPGSYINTADFTSPKELAEYLTKLDKDDKLYLEYHKWRQSYQINHESPTSGGGWAAKMPANKAWCDLCAALHNDSTPAQVYTDLQQWYLQDTCPHDHPNLFCTSWSNCCRRRKTTDLFLCF